MEVSSCMLKYRVKYHSFSKQLRNTKGIMRSSNYFIGSGDMLTL